MRAVVHRTCGPSSIPRYRKEEVVLIKELMEQGAYRAVTEQKTGNVVLTVGEG